MNDQERGRLLRRFALQEARRVLNSAVELGNFCFMERPDLNDLATLHAIGAVGRELRSIGQSMTKVLGDAEVTQEQLIEAFRNCVTE